MTDTPLIAPDPAPAGADVQRSRGENTRAVAREGGWAGVFNLVGAVIRYGNNLLLTRMLGADMYGLYALANKTVTILALPATLGFPTSLVHFVASYSETEQWPRLRWVMRAAFRTVLVWSFVVTGAALALSPWIAHRIYHKDGLVLPLAGLLLALPLLAVYAIGAGALQGLKEIRKKVFIERVAHPMVFMVLLLLGWAYFRDVGLKYVVACFLIAACVVVTLGLRWLRTRFARIPTVERGAPEWRGLLSFSTPLLFLGLLQQLILYSDVLVMGIFRKVAEVGVYNIASTLAVAVGMPTDAMGASVAPSFAGLMGKGDTEGLKRLFHTSTRWIFLLGTLVGLGLLLGGLPVLRLFGREYQHGYLALCLLATGQVFSASFGPNGTLITMTGYPKVNMVNALCLGLANLGLQFLMVPRYGAAGAAAAAALSMVAINVTRATEIWFLLKISPWDRTIIKPALSFLCGIIGGGAVFLWGHPLPAAVVGLLTYAGMWRLLGPEAEDLDMVARAWAKLRRGPLGGVRR